MAHHDDEHSAVPNQPPVAIGGSVPGDALVPGGSRLAGQAAQQNAYASPAAQGPDVLKGGMDHSWFLHSLRRRWLLALGMGLVFGGVATAVLWFMFPESSSAVALFRVSSEEPNLVFRGVANETRQFDILQKTQLALLKSHFVLQAAVRDPSIANLGALAGEDDPIQWLSQRVSVNFPQESEILSISLSGDEHSEDLRLIVDAVANAYQEQVIFADRNRKLSTRDVLRKSLAKLNDEIRRKMEDFQELAKEIGSPDLESSDAESRLLLSEISRQLGEFAALRNAAMELQAEFEIAQLHLKDPMLLEAQIDEMLTADPTVGMLQQQAMYLEFQLQDLQSRSRRGSKSEARIQKQLQGLQQQIAQHRQKQKQQMLNSQQSAPNLALRQATDDFRVRASMIRNRIGQLQQEMAVKREQLTALGEQSVDLAVRKSELDYLKEIGNDVALKIESWDVEMQAPSRIIKLQDAQITPGINWMQRYLISGFGGITCFLATCFAVAYVEFRNRRLNGPTQVNEGLGIRVIGTLPSLSSRRLLDPNHPVVAQLTESIDNVRTLLMHDSTSKQRQVVMVTSAMTLEGRTTVASQLAASLARAGRRTLLVDGDLRRPALHALFDVTLENGLCEVLRAEADVADVIQPTHAEGLWLLTAGYCDTDAIQAMAGEQLQPIFEKLRADYDFIIIDAAPVIGLSDSLLFGQYCDGAILSVLRDHSEVPKIHQAAELLRGVGIRLIGSVVNGVPTKSDRRVTQLRLSPPKSQRQQLQAN
jgi:capsular exopolysaccharide synthesis family protein